MNTPELSYIPEVCMTESVFFTISVESTLRPLIGQTPPLARVAAATESIRAVISILQHEKYRSSMV